MSIETATHTLQESDSAHLSDFLGDEEPSYDAPTVEGPVEGYLRHYEIIRPLGAGGMASVLLARDTKLARLVAIKFLRDGTGKGRDLLAEAQATARARHENIVVIYEVGSIDGRPYMVLEYLDGRTLREVMNTRSRGDGRGLPRGLSLEIIASVVRALGAAHRSGIVHLDLKPENIVMVDSGQVKVLDFGIASFMGQEERIRAGTRAYMSPEQWRGEDIDGRSDLWAAGIILHELLTGVHPLAPISTERLACVRDLEMAMPNLMDTRPELVGLSGIVARCLRKKREERYASADELLAALEPWVARSKRGQLRENECPFAGLSAFQEADADRFFGREREVLGFLGALGRQAIVAVAGASGAGKSSFIRAGVIPALRRSGEAWDVLVVRPGRAPLEALREIVEDESLSDLVAQPAQFGTALRARCRARGPGQRVLVFIDQFEELYTLVPDEAERAAFIACLLGAADDPSSPVRVVLSIRSDFLDRLAEAGAFWAQLSTGWFLLPPVSGEGLREALTEPVLAAGYGFESDELVDTMLEELRHTKNPLPILQFSATALWEARDSTRKLLTRAAYEAIGGVGGALAKHADAVLAALSLPEQAVCRAICLRLVTPEHTRALATLKELVALGKEPAIVEGVIDRLATARLIHLDTQSNEESATIEIVHESLLERWPTLARWLDQSADDAQFLARLRTAAAQWKAEGESTGLLWRDRAAEEARIFYDRYRQVPEESREIRFNALERRYLEAVLELAERAQRQRNRAIAAAFAIVCSVAIVVLWLALEARAAAARADDEAQHVRAQNTELALQALRGRNATRIMTARKFQNDPTTVISILREVEGPEVPKDWPELVSAALTQGVAADVWRTSPDRCAYSAAMNPDGSRIAVAMDDYSIRILGTDLKEHVKLVGHEKGVWSATWSRDGRRIVSASFDNTARIWNADGSGKPIAIRAHTDMVNSAIMSPNGKTVLTTSDDKTMRLWSADDGHELLSIKCETPMQTAIWNPDGSHIVSVGDDGRIFIWNGDAKGEPRVLKGHTDMVVTVSFRPDGKKFVTGSRDRTVRVWDMETGLEELVLRGHEEKVMSVEWSPDGTKIVSTSKDKTARIWQADGTGTPLILNGHGHWVYTASWSPDSLQILTTSLDGTQRRWKLRDFITPTLLRGHEDTVRAIAFSPDGKRLATASYDTTLRLWDIDGKKPPKVLRGHRFYVQFVRWNPDGQRLVTIGNDKTARIWFVNEDRESIVLQGLESDFQTCEWSPDGERLVTTQVDGSIRLWTKDGKEIAAVKKETTKEYKWIYAPFDPAGKRVLIQDTADHNVYIWNVDPPGELELLGEHESLASWVVKWNPDGSKILTISTDGIGRLWDAKTKSELVQIRSAKPIRNGLWTVDGKELIFILVDGTFIPWRNGVWGDPYGKGVALEGDVIVNWDPDGRRLVTGAPDGKVRVYDSTWQGAPFVLVGEDVRTRNAIWSPLGDRIAVHYEDKLVWLWPAVRPFSGLDDKRLWTTTSYCLSLSQRMELFGVSEVEAQKADEVCRHNVARGQTLP